MKKEAQKDEIFYRILNAAMILDMRHGHMKWKMSQLAKQAKVSRPLIYYYFGKAKDTILEEAISFFGNELSGDSPVRWQMWREGRIVDTLVMSREILKKVPAMVPFYFINRTLPTKLGEVFRKKESNFRGKVAKFFPDLSEEQREFFFACVWGLVFAPDLSDKSLKELDRYLKKAKADQSKA